MNLGWSLGAQRCPEAAAWATHATVPDYQPEAAPPPELIRGKAGRPPEKLQRILDRVIAFPGMTCTELADVLGQTRDNTNWQLIELRKRGLLHSGWAIPLRWFPA